MHSSSITTAGLDLGLLVTRLALGSMLCVHGWNKVFGPGGLSGTAQWFDGIGLRPGRLHALLASGTELGAGALVAIGLMSGLASMAVVGLMLVAACADHRGKGYFVFKGGWEYVALVALVAVGLAGTGPGGWSLDHALGLDLAGAWWCVAAAVGGAIAAAPMVLVVARRPALAGSGLS